MNDRKNIFEQTVKAILEKTGLDLIQITHTDIDHGTADIMIKGHAAVTYVIECKRYVAAYHVDRFEQANDSHHPVMVVAEQIAPPARELLRKKGIAYLEANGNAFIDRDHTTVFIDGNKPLKAIKPVSNRAFTKTGLKAVFHLLNDPEAIGRTYRQLAEETAVGLGNITYIMDGLEEAGFILPIDKRKVVLKNKKALLERWLAGYRETLKPDLLRGTFKMWNTVSRNEWQEIDTDTIDIQWGGEAAGEIMTGYLQAKNLTMYTGSLKAITGLVLIPTKEGDVQIYEKFWYQTDDEGPTAPPLLVYADLLITDDPRCIETARLIYDKYLKEQFDEK